MLQCVHRSPPTGSPGGAGWLLLSLVSAAQLIIPSSGSAEEPLWRLCGRAAVLAAPGVCLQCNCTRGSWMLLLVPQLPMPARKAESAGLADAGRSITLPSGPAEKPPPRVSVVPAQRTKTWPLNLGRGARSPQSLPCVQRIVLIVCSHARRLGMRRWDGRCRGRAVCAADVCRPLQRTVHDATNAESSGMSTFTRAALAREHAASRERLLAAGAGAQMWSGRACRRC